MQIAISSQTSSRNFILIAGLLLYCGAFAIPLGDKSFDAAGAVVVLIVFGIVLPLIAWITTRHAIPLSISIQSGAPELIVLIAYVVALSLYLIGGPQWIDQHLPSAWPDSLRIKVRHYVSEEAVRFRCYSVCDLSILLRLSSSRFWGSARTFARATRKSSTGCSCCGRSFPCFSIFRQRRRRCVSAVSYGRGFD